MTSGRTWNSDSACVAALRFELRFPFSVLCLCLKAASDLLLRLTIGVCLRTGAARRHLRLNRRRLLLRLLLRLLPTQRTNICHQLQQLLLAYLTLKRRHDRLVARDNFRARRQNRFANVSFVGDYLLTIG